jgi:hypothetical protein
MSHFPVLVIGDNPEDQLAPFQENNMGDCPKKYLEFFDVTQEYLDRYEQETVTKIKLEDGILVDPWDERFRVKPSGIGCDTHKVPENLERIEVPVKEIYSDFDSFISDWTGYEVDPLTRKYGYWENRNKKWDWYALGGRWSGYLLLKDGSRADTALAGTIDWQAMTAKNAKNAEDTYSKFETGFDASANYNSARAWFEFGIENIGTPDDFIPESRESYVERCSSVATFAILKDGVWYEKGNMGWWAKVHDEKEQGKWNSEFISLVQSLSDYTLISLYDCHI